MTRHRTGVIVPFMDHAPDIDAEERHAARILVSGRVQGVGFRWAVKNAAEAAGVVGTVRNLRDGSVEVWAEADEESLAAFIGAVFRGSPAGRVTDMRVDWTGAVGNWTDFRIVT